MLVLRNDLSGNLPFEQLLARNKQSILDAYSHQDIPFEMLVDELKPERNASHNALYQIVFAVQNFDHAEMEMTASQLQPYQPKESPVAPDYELGLHVVETEDELIFNFSCNTDVFFASTLERLAVSMQVLLNSIVANPSQNANHLELLDQQQKQILLVDWNNTEQIYPQDKCLHQLFESQAQIHSDNIAVEFNHQHLTYAQLNQQANQLAHYLIEQGIKADSLVGIYLERSIEMMVAMLAVLKAGGAYVPIDLSIPAERMQYIVEDAGLRQVLTDGELFAKAPFTDVSAVLMG